MAHPKGPDMEMLEQAIRDLVLGEVRVLRAEAHSAPSFLLDEMASTIRQFRRQVGEFVRFLAREEREKRVRETLQEILDQEIERSVSHRGNRCLRCVNMLIEEREESLARRLPLWHGEEMTFVCDRRKEDEAGQCIEYRERAVAVPMEDYLAELTLLYELRETLERFSDLWEE